MFHQIHYFAYAYVLLSVVYTWEGTYLPNTAMTIPYISAVTFLLGWLTYINGKWLLNDVLKLTDYASVTIGHIIVVVCLVIMAFNVQRIPVLISMWVLGGLGGGSVYAVKKLSLLDINEEQVELMENIGHVLGVLLTITGLTAFSGLIEISFIIAIIAAFATIAIGKLLQTTGNHPETKALGKSPNTPTN